MIDAVKYHNAIEKVLRKYRRDQRLTQEELSLYRK